MAYEHEQLHNTQPDMSKTGLKGSFTEGVSLAHVSPTNGIAALAPEVDQYDLVGGTVEVHVREAHSISGHNRRMLGDHGDIIKLAGQDSFPDHIAESGITALQGSETGDVDLILELLSEEDIITIERSHPGAEVSNIHGREDVNGIVIMQDTLEIPDVDEVDGGGAPDLTISVGGADQEVEPEIGSESDMIDGTIHTDGVAEHKDAVTDVAPAVEVTPTGGVEEASSDTIEVGNTKEVPNAPADNGDVSDALPASGTSADDVPRVENLPEESDASASQSETEASDGGDEKDKDLEFGDLVRTTGGAIHRPGEALEGPTWNRITLEVDTQTQQALLTATDIDGTKHVVGSNTWDGVEGSEMRELIGIEPDGTRLYTPARGEVAPASVMTKTPDGQTAPLAHSGDFWVQIDSRRIVSIDVTDKVLSGEMNEDYMLAAASANWGKFHDPDKSPSLDAYKAIVGNAESAAAAVPAVVGAEQVGYEPPSRDNHVSGPEDYARVTRDQVRMDAMIRTMRHVIGETTTTLQAAEAVPAMMDALQAAVGGQITIGDVRGYEGSSPGAVSNRQLETVRRDIDALYASGTTSGLPPKEQVDAFLAGKIADAERAGGWLRPERFESWRRDTAVERRITDEGVKVVIPDDAQYASEYVRAQMAANLEDFRRREAMPNTMQTNPQSDPRPNAHHEPLPQRDDQTIQQEEEDQAAIDSRTRYRTVAELAEARGLTEKRQE